MKGNNMKITNKLLITATIAFGILTTSANAQYKPTGDDGITASPKLRAQLNERKASTTTTATSASTMACLKCTDILVPVKATDSKVGSRALLGKGPDRVAKHACATCVTTISVTGTGKATHNVATHTCTGCGTLACSGDTGKN